MADPKTQFTDLPLELRDMVWEFALPPPRVFQVKRIGWLLAREIPPSVYRITFSGRHATTHPASRHFRCFEFQREYPVPVVTQICCESRAAALRAGYFLLPTFFSAETPRISSDVRARMVWFGGPVDFLYFSFPADHATLNYGWGHRPISTPCLSLIQNVGVEWVYLFQGAQERPYRWPRSTQMRHWQGHVLPLYEIPAARRCLWVIFPAARSENTGDFLGEEPRELFNLDARLAPVYPFTSIPLRAGRYPWQTVRTALQNALAHRKMRIRSYELFGDGVWYQPEIKACILERAGALPSDLARANNVPEPGDLLHTRS